MTTRISTFILIGLIAMNGGFTIYESSGLSEDVGVDLAPGISDSVNQAIDTAQDAFSPSTGVIESFVGIVQAAAGFFLGLLNGLLFATPTAFINVGFPEYLVAAIFAPAYLIASLELLFIRSGRDIV